MADSKISWTHKVWNPVTGCTRVSPGCGHCYAFALHDKRYAANVVFAKTWSGLHDHGDRKLENEGWMTWAERVGKPREGWAQRARSLGLTPPWPAQYDKPFSTVQLMPERIEQPLHWKKPRRIFVNSMSDLFHEDVPDEFIGMVFKTMGLARQHTYQILTKRPERMQSLLSDSSFQRYFAVHLNTMGLLESDPTWARWPLPNVWLGVSVEDQQRADERIPLLLDTPAAVRFISAEPLLGPVNLVDPMVAMARELDMTPEYEWDWLGHRFVPNLNKRDSKLHGYPFCKTCGNREGNPFHASAYSPKLDWVIVGGESGKGWRPMDHEWARRIREQCRAAGVAYFGKQDSAHRNEVPLPGDLGDQEFPTPQ